MTVVERMGEIERKRRAFHHVATPARTEVIFAVAQRIRDGTLTHAHGAFTTAAHGQLPPDAQ